MCRYHNLFFILVVALEYAQGHGAHETPPLVRTRLGSLKGSFMESKRGDRIYAFRGIPYANHTRFQPPTPIKSYIGTVDATQDGPACPSTTYPGMPMAEDCLILNVYSKRLPSRRRSRGYPVLVFFHAGGWYSGSGQSFIEGPQYLLDHDIVLVTVNYRLGSLGLISTGTKEAPGNNALKDQVEAMRWVKRHIKNFGGDSDMITIIGYSAGSISVALHMLSPMTRGLFHRVIAMSGCPTANWDIPSNRLDLAEKQARLMNCPYTSPQEIIKCLKTINAEALGNTLPRFAEFGSDPVLLWVPVVENDFGQERYLVEHPLDTIKKGDIADVELLTGMTQFEFAGQAYYVLMNETLLDALNANWETIAPIILQFERNSERSRMISAELGKAFLDFPLANDDKSKQNLGILYADALIGFGAHRFANLIAERSRKPVYYYKFSYTGRYSHFYLPGTDNKVIGPVHHDDLLYLFYVELLFPRFNDTDPEMQIVNLLTKMWTDFAKSGNPTPAKHGFKWKPFQTDKQNYCNIDTRLEMKECLYCDRYKVWDREFPLPEGFQN